MTKRIAAVNLWRPWWVCSAVALFASGCPVTEDPCDIDPTGCTSSGEFTVTHEGDNAIASILPAGLFTHLWTQKLNGTLRSPVVPAGTSPLVPFSK